MKMNKQVGLALLLITFGTLILLSKMGFHIGHHLMGFLFPAAMVGLGFLGLKNGKSIIGWILIVFGGMILLGKMSGWIGILIAGGLIWYGVSMLRGKKAY